MSKEKLAIGTDLIKNEIPIIIPTETTYGIVADASSKKAVQLVFNLKNRPKIKPFAIFTPSLKNLLSFKPQNPFIPRSELIRILKTGATAIIPFEVNSPIFNKIPKNIGIKKIIKGKHYITIGVRIPKSKTAKSILRRCKCILIATSANKTGKEPINKGDEIQNHFNNTFIIKADSETSGIPSTIVNTCMANIPILRHGNNLKEQTIKRIIQN